MAVRADSECCEAPRPAASVSVSRACVAALARIRRARDEARKDEAGDASVVSSVAAQDTHVRRMGELGRTLA